MGGHARRAAPLTMSIPMVISMLVQALYNVVDSMFVAQISENALTAVSLCLPCAESDDRSGDRNRRRHQRPAFQKPGRKRTSAGQTTPPTMRFSSPYAASSPLPLIGGIFSRVFFRLQTDVTEIIDYGTAYLQICTIGSIGLFLQVTFEKLLQATGRTFYTMLTQGLGAIINIVLDPILIFGLLGMPKMGVAGAAVATICGQIIASILAVVLNMKKKSRDRTEIQGIPSKQADHRPHLFCRRSFHHDGCHRLRHDLRHQQDFDFLYNHGDSRLRGIFQAAELRLHAHLRT